MQQKCAAQLPCSSRDSQHEPAWPPSKWLSHRYQSGQQIKHSVSREKHNSFIKTVSKQWQGEIIIIKFLQRIFTIFNKLLLCFDKSRKCFIHIVPSKCYSKESFNKNVTYTEIFNCQKASHKCNFHQTFCFKKLK